MLFKPFNIENQTGEWYVDLILFSLGIVFFLSIFFIEFLIPYIAPRCFTNWTLGKAIIWYTWVILFVGAVIFLYKSFLGGFKDFTWTEYFFVIGRVLVIAVTVSFFALGVFSYFNRKQFSLLSSNERYSISAPNAKPLQLNLNEIMYIVSDDNYVDIHLEKEGKRKKKVFRSSLKNIESQIVNPVSPIYRCHRKYLINIQYFEIHKINSRSMSILLQKYLDEIPVSKKYAEQINELLHIHH
ncbi:LytTR family transcriptional regulator DNA-binding domain-containing protein [Aquimarina gracilis]|uniref:LytTR family transcriptional regulator DNA-binding domain-containing protein n=1 Tax=Aquimarina gracilis TaxID=874422 RepID=A0ABU5ZXV1_9FLAO|nr:LytTR family transcriptional regulator DNA-binding domain-containing protein [Aquimarina gracilis]MEB3346696.1 LytTR family transcriptional regulator DNA-binding domain-containing protein [Aquimarina gracilis]